MTRPEDDARRTTRLRDDFHGSPVFDQAAAALGLNELLARKIVWEAARDALVDPFRLTIADVGNLLPEIERRVRLVVHEDLAAAAMARVRQLVFSWGQ
jgi:hypothetical protein